MLAHPSNLIVSGFHKSSIAYLSTGVRRYNQPFTPTSYGPQFVQGDVIGVGYRPRTGTIFFTRNGKKLEDVAHGLKTQNFFPAVGANGPAVVHVNFGQAGFVFIEANVKKWGLAPVTGSLAPPPPYGSEQGSILLEAGRKDGYSGSPARNGGHSHMNAYSRPNSHVLETGHNRTRSGNFRVLSPTSPGPVRSPTDISLAHLVPTDDPGEASSSAAPGDRPDDHTPAVGLGLHFHHAPPPEYSSPTQSDNGSDDGRRSSSDSDNTPLIHVARSRGASSATLRPAPLSMSAGRARSTSNTPAPQSPPIPSYTDALRQGAGRERSNSARSAGRSSGP
jgi:hypothetical protein